MTLQLPYRGDGTGRPVDLAEMPMVLHGRPRKQWRYVGVFGERLMLCAGVVRIGPFPQTFWAVWDRDKQALRERTRLRAPRSYVRLPDGRVWVEDGGVAIDLVVDPGVPVETVSEAGDAWIWTRKQGAVRVHGTVTLEGEPIAVDALGCVDESAGFHSRLTEWEWSAGVGSLSDGRSVGWNLVTGIHDAETGSERTVWVDGVPTELPPVSFASDLSSVTFPSGESLTFSSEAVRERNDDFRVFKSDYRQPFGAFAGTLPGGLQVVEGRGVMERHSALW
ncbi:MAG: hypothetical protein AVDCRST_MAG85-1072 [uncultured Solirubrobacteraceae bacterium]|uniref:DUF2804 family protein n=1 Tax=uncultured Solirubrobacteraceae bacterium TaxID=1162706 RepID=A0A6J4S3X9_9ACTN|nr:MAG: hypothetical protein AVDCRST_MAG85-1072 [uncultured Solirubrobacteraceae bacterium]